jgi:hypothetical protein
MKSLSKWCVAALPWILACSAEGREIGASPAPSATEAGAPASTGPASNDHIDGNDDAGKPSAPLVSEVYGNSGTELYRLDPNTKAVTDIGSFDGCTGVVDIALDEDSNLFGTTSKGLYKIDRNTAKCTSIASGEYPNSLSFVPKGTVDGNVEALVGYNEDVYVRIDPSTGKVSPIGSLGQGYTSSGDIVSVKGGGTYLTV